MPSRPPSGDNLSPNDNVVKVDFKRFCKTQNGASSTNASTADLQKLELFDDLLKQGVTALMLDGTHEEVQVPSAYKEVPNLRLNFSHRYGLTDFVYDEWGVKATLSFPEGLYYCAVPWKAIFIMELGDTNQGAVWPEDVPLALKPAYEMKEKSSKESQKEPVIKKSSKAKKGPAPFLRLVPDETK